MSELNENKVEEMKYDILKLEDENSKTKQLNNSEMVDKIKQIIKDGVKNNIK
ncbi:MAG: hypothetical protein K2N61_07270 [Lachnospiraceae bacterium]|nr:hypothetical protein [Lachnospiraceae bacterium]